MALCTAESHRFLLYCPFQPFQIFFIRVRKCLIEIFNSRDILCHNASRTDHGILPNGNTRHHDHASTQPAVASDADGQIVLVCFLPQFRQDRVVKESFSFFSRFF